MRVAIVKPDYGVAGGFEAVVERVGRGLARAGHDVQWRLVPVGEVGRSPFGVEIPEAVWERAWEAFRFLGLLERFRALDLAGADLVISTQPPSYAVRHDRVLALFYHHLRIYYDLSGPYVAAGFADPELHDLAEKAVHRVDDHFLPGVAHFLAGSAEVAGRLERFHGYRENVSLFEATSDVAEIGLLEPPPDRFDRPLCVSRHEFPKRTELFVVAMKHLPAVEATIVGTGGRLAFVRDLDARLSLPGAPLDSLGEHGLWLNRGDLSVPFGQQRSSNVHFAERTGQDELADLYRSALCVVAPAYLEDYGLTAVEAMAFGKPVVACTDGGGLAELVDDGVTGFLVEPDGASIAAAVKRFVEDPGLAREMGRKGRERASQLTWDHAMAGVAAGIERVMG